MPTAPEVGWSNITSPGTALITLSASVAFSKTENLSIKAQGAIPVRDGATTPIVASFTATPRSPKSFTWDFDASASEPSAGASIESYAWDFDDSQQTSGASPLATHEFDEPGTYQVTLTVRDSNDEVDVTSREVVVADPGLVVNSVADDPNGAESGVRCDTGNSVGGEPECTLRAAIEAANTADRAQTISFAIDVVGNPQITLTSSLPDLTAPATIDGTTQEGGWVEVASPNDTMQALSMTGDDSAITGMLFRGFGTTLQVSGNDARVTSNRFGTNAAGTQVTSAPKTAVLAGRGEGIVIEDNVMAVSAFGIQIIEGGTGTVADNRIGVNASGSSPLGPMPRVAIALRDIGPWTVADNVIHHSSIGVWLRGSATAGTQISGNRIGLDQSGSTQLQSTGVGIIVDGVPGAVVTDNLVAMAPSDTGLVSIDILVTGVAQCPSPCTQFPAPGQEVGGPVTGADARVSRNRLGMAGDAAPQAGTLGLAVYAKARNVTIDENTTAGHTDAEVLVAGVTNAKVLDNRIGTNAAGDGALGGHDGVKIAGATDTEVTGNVVSGLNVNGVVVTDYVASDGVAATDSAGTVLADNRIGTNLAGTGAVPNRIGVLVRQGSERTGIAFNVVSGNTSNGIEVTSRAKETNLFSNRVGTTASGARALPNGTGITVSGDAADTKVVANVVGGNLTSGVALTTSDFTTVVRNRIGVNEAGAAIPNATGVTLTGKASIAENRVWNNGGIGIEVLAGSQGLLLGNSTFANGGKGIVAPAVPAAPKLDVVQADFARGGSRTWFVIDRQSRDLLPQLFAIPDCSDPNEGRDRIPIEHLVTSGAGLVVIPQNPLPDGYSYTATVVDISDTKGPGGQTTGATSEYSNCAAPAPYPDTSGTGIPDIIQTALGGNPSKQDQVVFPSDGGTRVELSTNAGKLTNVRPVSVPDGADDLDLPAGLYAFEITGLEPGATASVSASTGADTSSYFRYGRTSAAGQAAWYRWDFDAATGLGATPLSPDEGQTSLWQLDFKDGSRGDDDLTANGTIVDPGGPGTGTVGVPPPTTPTSPPISTAAPPPSTPAPTAGSSATGGELARTGRDLGPLVAVGFVCMIVGLGLLTRSGRRRLG